MFPDVEDGVWRFDDEAGQYYRHSFYRHQPDLATDDPVVREEIAKVIGFWLQLGIDGFRVDAVPHLIDTEDGAEHEFLRALRGYVSRRSGSGMMLGEVNLPYDEMVAFFGEDDGDELTMQFDFVANQALYLSLARQDAAPLAAALADRPALAQLPEGLPFDAMSPLLRQGAHISAQERTLRLDAYGFEWFHFEDDASERNESEDEPERKAKGKAKRKGGG